MSLVAIVANPLTEPVPAGWDEFAAANRLLPVWHSESLRVADWCAQSPSSMVLIREASSDTPVAAFHARHLGPTRPGWFARPGRVPALSLTECRSAPMMGSGVAFGRDLDARDRTEAVQVFEQALGQRVRAGGRLVAYRHLSAEQLAAFPTAGRLRMRLSPHMVLEVDWPDLPGYLASLPRKWARRVERIRAEVERDDTVRVELVSQVDPAQACWLAERVRRRHLPRGRPHPTVPAGFFHSLNQLPNSQFLTYQDQSGRLLAFVAMHDTGEEVFAGVLGRRSEAEGGRRNLYFDLYLRQVEWMIKLGRRRLVLGAGMAEIKTRFGARADPRWGVLGLR